MPIRTEKPHLFSSETFFFFFFFFFFFVFRYLILPWFFDFVKLTNGRFGTGIGTAGTAHTDDMGCTAYIG
jgi:hypothetical protein